MEMRGLWRASNEERSQKTPVQPRQSSGLKKVGQGVGGWQRVYAFVKKEEEKGNKREAGREGGNYHILVILI